VTVRFQEAFDSQVATDRQQAFRRRMFDGGEAEVARISAQPHHG
jgi:hypothetical protein